MSQELKDAIAGVQGMLVAHRSLLKLEMVLRQAESAENIVKERTEQLQILDSVLSDKRAELEALNKTQSTRLADLESDYARRQQDLSDQLQRDESARMVVLSRADAAYREQEASRASVLSSLDSQVSQKQAELADLSARASELQAIYDDLRLKLTRAGA